MKKILLSLAIMVAGLSPVFAQPAPQPNNGTSLTVKNNGTTKGAVSIINFTTGQNATVSGNTATVSSVGTSPAGSSTDIQSNSSGSFYGDSGLVYVTPNVGIGTTVPDRILDVVASDTNTTITTPSLASMGIKNINSATANNFADLAFSTTDTNGAIQLGAKISGIFTSHSPGAVTGGLEFLNKTAGTTSVAMRIIGGNVGIGTTTATLQPASLSVNGNTTGKIITSTNYAPQSVGGGAGVSANQDDGNAMLGGNRLALYTFGGPTDTLHDIYYALSMEGNSNAGVNWTAISAPGYLTFNTTPTGTITRLERMRIDSQGNIGIGSTNPSVKLDVNGTIRGNHFTGANQVTLTVCSSLAVVTWNCDYTVPGVNDQTDINLAITAVHNLGGGKVLLSEGPFYIGANNTPIIPLSNVSLEGMGGLSGATILYISRGLIGIGGIGNVTSTVTNFTMKGLKIDGTDVKNNATYSTQQKGVSITFGQNDSNINADDIWIYNTNGSCYAIDDAKDSILTNFRFDTCGNPSDYTYGSNGLPLGMNGFGYGTGGAGINEGITISNGVCVNIASACILFEEQAGSTSASWGFSISNIVDRGSYNTLRASGVQGVVATNLHSYNDVNSSYVFTTDTFVNQAYSDISLSNSFSLSAGKGGVIIGQSSSAAGTNITVDNVVIDTPAEWGVEVGASNVVLSNMVIVNAVQEGIYDVGYSSSNIKIKNSHIINSGTGNVSTHKSGIGINILTSYTQSGLDIEGNTITGSTGYGIDTELTAGTLASVYLKNNDLTGNTSGAVNSTVLTIGSNFFPFGNHGYTTNNYVEGNLNVGTNVGIGSLSPGAQLDINGTARMKGFIDTTSPSNNYIMTSDAAGNGTWQAAGAATGQWTENGSNIYNNNAGNVGIGTSLSANLLDIAGGVEIGTAYAGYKIAPANGLMIQGNVGIGTTTNSNLISAGSLSGSGTQSIDILGGTSSESRIVEINTGGVTASFASNNSGTTDSQGIPNGEFGIGSSSSSAGVIATNGVARIFVGNAGNVGIGSTNPGGNLDMSGGTLCLNHTCKSSWPAGTVTSITAGTGLGGGTISTSGTITSNAEQTVNYQPGLLTAVNSTVGVYGNFVKASTVDNIIGSAITFSCVSNPTVTMYECGTSITCTSPTTIGSVTITSAGTAFVGTVSSAAITAGDYVGFTTTAGTCASIDLAVTAQVHSN